MMNGVLRGLAVLATLLFAAESIPAFDGVAADPGSHLEITRTAIQAVYHTSADLPELVSVMPVFGLRAYRWSVYRATDLLADAARDFDSFYFGMSAAHAQTADFPYRRDLTADQLRAIEIDAVWAYLRFMADGLQRSKAAFLGGRSREGAYLFGAFMHAYQDLWSNRGSTAAMYRALAAYENLDLDRDPARIAEIRERLPAWLVEIPKILGAAAGEGLLAFLRSDRLVEIPSINERAKLLGRRRDVFWESIKNRLFARADRSSLRFMAAISWDVDSLDAILMDGVELSRIAEMDDREEFMVFLSARAYRY